MRFSIVGGVVAGLVLSGCSTWSEPPPPANAQPVVSGANAELARGGIDNRWSGPPGGAMRSKSTGTTSASDENRPIGWRPSPGGAGPNDVQTGPPGSEPATPTANAAAPGSTLDASPVFRPSSHVFVDGVDTGPSAQVLYVSGAAAKPKS